MFPDGAALARYLARRTETGGYADPARWKNRVINGQADMGRPAHIRVVSEGWYSETWKRWYGRIVEKWDWWFHDAAGRTVDVRAWWPDAVAMVLRGDTGREKFVFRHCRGPRRRRHVHRWGGQKGRVGFYLRGIVPEDFYDDEGDLIARWEPRGKLRTTARLVADWDWFDMRARNSSGWKDRKCAHQWEHRVREKEKHDKSRARKAARRGEFPGGVFILLEGRAYPKCFFIGGISGTRFQCRPGEGKLTDKVFTADVRSSC